MTSVALPVFSNGITGHSWWAFLTSLACESWNCPSYFRLEATGSRDFWKMRALNGKKEIRLDIYLTNSTKQARF